MDEITALGQEYLKREDTFHAFADGFLKWATDHCPRSRRSATTERK